MISALMSIYMPTYPRTLVYMLQNTEYQVWPYLKWFWRTQNFNTVIKRRTLDKTKPARLLLLALKIGIAIELLLGLVLIYAGFVHHVPGGVPFGAALLVGYPILWAHLLIVPIVFGRVFITKPQEQKLIEESKAIFAQHPGIKIAVAGSYGKTSMKELLKTVLSEGLDVAATPANKNVSVSHAYFARKLRGNEDALIIEYGEGKPGDIARFAGITQPTHAVITGLAPAHLDHYKTLQAAGTDIFSLSRYVPAENIYVNSDSPDVASFIQSNYQIFNNDGALSWKASAITTTVAGTNFTITKGKQKLVLHSGLIGKHQVGFLVYVAAMALELGLTHDEVKLGLAKTKPFEHRMQPYQLGGAWIIDDTYNGNLEGIRAGTELLRDLDAQRKIYVSPGLVDQGKQSSRVHTEMGKLIAAAKPDLVVLMQNSATEHIRAGLEAASYGGEIQVETDPLNFYTNLTHFVAAGDLVVMQNDWTDNYA